MEKLMGLFKPDIPEKYRADFYRQLLTENYSRLFPTLVVLFILEAGLYLVRDRLFGVGPVIGIFLLVNVVMLPVIWVVNARIASIATGIAKMVQSITALMLILFGMALVLFVQQDVDLL
ncbi:hypothetical protein LPY66_07350 [Dehalobacter sp. DCM]|uniref:hypothetical protein n=1 Tax=Dehalobacter sp. DCM TaxID=2907827 RepID=UPI003081DFDA|nr:hypothetical protein LPY66_07350 [Dehalobacter sp. DCM]